MYRQQGECFQSPWRSGDGTYTSIEPYDVTARDYGSFVVLTGSSRIDAAYKGTRFLIDCRFTDVWGNIDGKWLDGGTARDKQNGLRRASPAHHSGGLPCHLTSGHVIVVSLHHGDAC